MSFISSLQIPKNLLVIEVELWFKIEDNLIMY